MKCDMDKTHRNHAASCCGSYTSSCHSVTAPNPLSLSTRWRDCWRDSEASCAPVPPVCGAAHGHRTAASLPLSSTSTGAALPLLSTREGGSALHTRPYAPKEWTWERRARRDAAPRAWCAARRRGSIPRACTARRCTRSAQRTHIVSHPVRGYLMPVAPFTRAAAAPLCSQMGQSWKAVGMERGRRRDWGEWWNTAASETT